jgi:hypothetical protein
MELKFFGHSDNQFRCDGVATIEQRSGATASFLLAASHGGMIVTGAYGLHNRATWAVGIAQTTEGAPLPAWPLRFELAPDDSPEESKPYSPLLIVDCPDDTAVIPMDWQGESYRPTHEPISLLSVPQ